jgi:hypothetical protein
MESKTQTVKFEALTILNEAKTSLDLALSYLEYVKDLKGDNEAQPLCEALIFSITKDRNTLSRAIKEAQEFW